MAVYYKLKSEKDYRSFPIDGHFVSVGVLKSLIFGSKVYCSGTRVHRDYDIIFTNPGTNEDYLDESMLIPKYSSVIIRRVPGPSRSAIVVNDLVPDEGSGKIDDLGDRKVAGRHGGFGRIGVAAPRQGYVCHRCNVPGHLIQHCPMNSRALIPDEQLMLVQSNVSSNADEESKIRAVVETPALGWSGRNSVIGGSGGGFGTVPPQGYVCHRCRVPGHLIQRCPTNGDPAFDKSKPVAAVTVLEPNEAALQEHMPNSVSAISANLLGPELHCPLCKQVMRDAVLTSRCCFKSFCGKCIRDHYIASYTKSVGCVCVCGANNVLVDHLLPNQTVRTMIRRILDQSSSTRSSSENGGSALSHSSGEQAQVQTQAQAQVQSQIAKTVNIVPQQRKIIPGVSIPPTRENEKVGENGGSAPSHSSGEQVQVQADGPIQHAKAANNVLQQKKIIPGVSIPLRRENAKVGEEEVHQQMRVKLGMGFSGGHPNTTIRSSTEGFQAPKGNLKRKREGIDGRGSGREFLLKDHRDFGFRTSQLNAYGHQVWGGSDVQCSSIPPTDIIPSIER